MTFDADLNRAAKNFQRDANARVRRVALAALRQIDEGSPVDKGTFAANWVASIGTIDRSCDLSKTKKDRPETMSKASAVITSGAKVGTTVYISNSVPYAGKLEDGYSPQAPAGIVAPAVTVIKNAIGSGRL